MIKISGAQIEFPNGDILKGIIGDVSDGHIIESGSNANGSWTKYADGTMECRKKLTYTGTIAAASGSMFLHNLNTPVQVGDYAIPFVGDVPVEEVTSHGVSGSACFIFGATGATSISAGGAFYLARQVSTVSQTYELHVVATGRWKA